MGEDTTACHYIGAGSWPNKHKDSFSLTTVSLVWRESGCSTWRKREKSSCVITVFQILFWALHCGYSTSSKKYYWLAVAADTDIDSNVDPHDDTGETFTLLTVNPNVNCHLTFKAILILQ